MFGAPNGWTFNGVMELGTCWSWARQCKLIDGIGHVNASSLMELGTSMQLVQALLLGTSMQLVQALLELGTSMHRVQPLLELGTSMHIVHTLLELCTTVQLGIGHVNASSLLELGTSMQLLELGTSMQAH